MQGINEAVRTRGHDTEHTKCALMIKRAGEIFLGQNDNQFLEGVKPYWELTFEQLGMFSLM